MHHLPSFSTSHNSTQNERSLSLLLYDAGMFKLFFSSFTGPKASLTPVAMPPTVHRTVFMVCFIFYSFTNLASEAASVHRYVPTCMATVSA